MSRPNGRDRGQTTIDYVLGVSLFLLIIASVFAFVPTVFAPFSGESAAQLVFADRSADRLTADVLAESGRTGTLNATCTEEFFDADGNTMPGCRFETDAADLPAVLGAGATPPSVNVTVRKNGGISSLDGTTLSVGPSPPGAGDVAVARRTVLLAGENVQVVVRVW